MDSDHLLPYPGVNGACGGRFGLSSIIGAIFRWLSLSCPSSV